MAKSKELLVDEGLRVSLIETALFDGTLEIPHINAPDSIIIPKGLVPFSQRERSQLYKDFVCFYENDINFRDVLTHTEDYVEDLMRFPGIISPDCSLYLDAPLCVQITSVYLNRAVGYYLQSKGVYVIPNIRWGDERTYTNECFDDKVAFLGVEKHSVVSIGTYGQIKSAESKRLFREGLIAMLEELEPKIVIVYGPMPDSIFQGLFNMTQFIQFPDWISKKKQESRSEISK